MTWLINKLRRVFMPHLYDLNPQLKAKKEPTVVKPKAAAPKKRGRPKGSKNKK
jgi:hypothetical protein